MAQKVRFIYCTVSIPFVKIHLKEREKKNENE